MQSTFLNLSHSIPSLQIVEQTSLGAEIFSRDGDQKNVHVVVKNSAFYLKVLFVNPSNDYNFHTVKVDPVLIYDCPRERIVDFVKHKPLEHKIQSHQGTELSVEIKIKVLSSQLEDMLFRIKLMCYDADTLQPIPKLYAVSQPIRVVSKPEQVLKKSTKRAPKRTLAERMADCLSTIAEQQRAQEELLKTLLEAKASEQSEQSTNEEPSPKSTSPLAPPTLESAFENLYQVWCRSAGSSSERAAKLRRVTKQLNSNEVGVLGEMTSQLNKDISDEAGKVQSPRAKLCGTKRLFPFSPKTASVSMMHIPDPWQTFCFNA